MGFGIDSDKWRIIEAKNKELLLQYRNNLDNWIISNTWNTNDCQIY